jgi:hypothetical protein
VRAYHQSEDARAAARVNGPVRWKSGSLILHRS